MSDPRVSVVMTTYNRHTYLREAIDSVLRQTMPDFEFIIVNDGSTTEEVLELLSEVEGSDSRIKLVHQDNQGLAGARNSGVRCASAPLIALMDDDDISRPDRLKAQVEHLDRNEDLPSVSTSMTFIDEGGKRTRSPKAIQAPVVSPKAPSFGDALAIVDKVVQNATIMARRAAWDEVGGYRAWFRQTEDMDLTLRFMERHMLSKIPDRVYLHRNYYASHRLSRGGKPWDYLAAAVLSFHCRLCGLPDPVPSTSVDDVHDLLGTLPGIGRRYLIWKARGALRKCLQDGNRGRFEDVWSKCRGLVKDEEDRSVLRRLRGRLALWRVRYMRPWSIG